MLCKPTPHEWNARLTQSESLNITILELISSNRTLSLSHSARMRWACFSGAESTADKSENDANIPTCKLTSFQLMRIVLIAL